MIADFITLAEAGKPVYINTVFDYFNGLDESESQCLHCLLSLLEEGQQRYFPIRIPLFGKNVNENVNENENEKEKETEFIREYIRAELYNILSSLGGKRMDIFIDDSSEELRRLAEDLNRVFSIDCARKDRSGYGRAVNVIDRMLETLAPGEKGFRFYVNSLNKMPAIGVSDSASTSAADIAIDTAASGKENAKKHEIYESVTRNMEGKLFCGIDVGGTDIKIVLVIDGSAACYKEYDWFPAQFTSSMQLVEPICLIVRLMRAKASLDIAVETPGKAALEAKMAEALDISASGQLMTKVCDEVEKYLNGSLAEIDGVGMCFPDVVVRNKIVGGEVYKTRGIRNNPDINYEDDFIQLTNLNDRIHELIKKDGKVLIINDGPMASFTAAVEIAASENPELIRDGVFAHTLGTELGTGWVTEKGSIPDIPLEVYNFIIDLGSYNEKKYAPDELRSINNFNTKLPGTLQKYTSQSGVFRLAMKYFPKERPDLFQELLDKGFVTEKNVNGESGYFVPTEPKDLRKPFLEHMMSLPERESDEVNERIWKEIGEFLAVTWIETKKILNPQADSRILFGRLVKRKRCFELMCEGAKNIKHDIQFEAADSAMANTVLMKQLEADPHFTVAQFAQAIGAVYFVNQP